LFKQLVLVLALDDFYASGQRVVEDNRWLELLADSLEMAGIVVENVEIIACTGWSTSDLALAAEASSMHDDYSLSF
jgi:hypothetical protein